MLSSVSVRWPPPPPTPTISSSTNHHHHPSLIPSPPRSSSNNAAATLTPRFAPHSQRLLPCRVMNHGEKVLATTDDASSSLLPQQQQHHMIDAHYWKMLCPSVRPTLYTGANNKVYIPGASSSRGTIVGQVPHRVAVSVLVRGNEKVRVRYNNSNKQSVVAAGAELLPSNAFVALKLQNVLVVENLPVPLHISTIRLGLEFALNRRLPLVRLTDFAPRYRNHAYWQKGGATMENDDMPIISRTTSPSWTTTVSNGPPDDVDPVAGCCRACGELHNLRFLVGACYCQACDPQRRCRRQQQQQSQQRQYSQRQPFRARTKAKHQRPQKQATKKKQPPPTKPVSLYAALPTARGGHHDSIFASSTGGATMAMNVAAETLPTALSRLLASLR